MLDIVGTLKAELCEIWSSFGGPESVMLSRQPHTILEGDSEVWNTCVYGAVESL